MYLFIKTMGYFQVKVICQWLKAKDKELSLFAMSYSFSCQGQEKSGASFFMQNNMHLPWMFVKLIQHLRSEQPLQLP